MSDVSKNIKKLRLDANMTQDTLAEKLNVTRQTISNYEKSKTQPDLQMLRAIADVFETDEMGVIYGKKPSDCSYPQNRTFRIRFTFFFGAAAAILLCIKLLVFPHLYIQYCYQRYVLWPVYLNNLLLMPLLSASVSIFFLSLLSVWKDIRIRSIIIRRIFLLASAVLGALYYLIPLLPGIFPRTVFLTAALALWNNAIILFTFMGIGIFLGFNR